MTDSFRLYRQDLATYVDLGTWIDASKQINFGDDAMRQAQFQHNPYFEGGILTAEISTERKQEYPILVPSSIGGGVSALEGTIRTFAQQGGVLDIALDGGGGKYVRFNVLSGRLIHSDYLIGIQRAGRRRATVELVTEPFGYWPTQIILASTASVGSPGRIDMSAAGPALIGDAPALMEVTVAPTSPSMYAAGSWGLDVVAWSVAARPSFTAWWPGASWGAPAGAASTAGDAFAPASQTLVVIPPTSTNWNVLARATVLAAVEPGYRGHYRALGLFKSGTGALGLPWQLSIDSSPVGGSQGLASVGRVATFGFQTGVVSPSPGYAVMDLGEIVLPLVGSGYPQDQLLRVWGKANAASAQIQFAGLFLMPLDGEAGILPRGLSYPSIGAGPAAAGKLVVSAPNRQGFVAAASAGSLGTSVPQSPLTYYRGTLSPQVGASAFSFDLLVAHRHPGSFTGAGGASITATAPMAIESGVFSAVSVTYQPRWAFVSAENV